MPNNIRNSLESSSHDPMENLAHLRASLPSSHSQLRLSPRVTFREPKACEPSNAQAQVKLGSDSSWSGRDILTSLPKATTAWRTYDVGYFAPDNTAYEHRYCEGGSRYFTNVYAFVNHLRGLSTQMEQTTIQDNIHSCLRGKALDWFAGELSPEEQKDLALMPLEEGWYKQLIQRFQPLYDVSLHAYKNARYGLEDAEARRDPVVWAHNVMRHAQACGKTDPYGQLRRIWYSIDLNLQWPVHFPKRGAPVSEFMKELDDAYLEWCHEQEAKAV